MKNIKLTQSKFALVDDEDFEWLNQWKWHVDIKGYARRTKWMKKEKKYKYIFMHKLINNTFMGMLTDHINRNKLDNRRINLRTVNKSINNFNRDIQKNNTSAHVGVGWNKWAKKWRVRISQTSLGYYSNLNDAIFARKEAEKRIYG